MEDRYTVQIDLEPKNFTFKIYKTARKYVGTLIKENQFQITYDFPSDGAATTFEEKAAKIPGVKKITRIIHE